MDIKKVIKKTTSYREHLLEQLQEKDFAKLYLETAFESYQEDKDTNTLLLAMGDVAQAQGGVGKLAKKTAISREHLYDILASRHNPKLDNWLDILSALGFCVRLEPQKKLVKREFVS